MLPVAQLFVQPLKLAFNRNSVRFLSAATSYQYILVDRKGTDQRVGVVTLHRPKVLNALLIDLVREMGDALVDLDRNPEIRAMVLTGSEKAFSAGVDISQLLGGSEVPGKFLDEHISHTRKIDTLKKPLIAAVNGYVFGGASELMLMCDIIYAGEGTKIGQLEIKHGIMPGDGGTQRLARYIGKSRAMELCLTGEIIDANEALRIGLVSKVFPNKDVLDEAIRLADRIGELSEPAVAMCKASVKNAYETHLQEGLRAENVFFKSIFNSQK